MSLVHYLIAFFILIFSSNAYSLSKPNIVIIFTDDQGYADLGCFGAENHKTPNLDRMASEGRKFTDFYVPQAVCGASRAALLTGCYPNRIGMLGAPGPKSRHGINPNEILIPELLKTKGYSTAMFGKWHLGHHKASLPIHHGFDEYYGLPYSNDMWPHHPGVRHLTLKERLKKWPNLPMIEGDKIIDHEVTPEEQTHLTTGYTNRAVNFINQNKDKPFFLMLSPFAVHIPLGAMSAKVDKYTRKAEETKRELPHPVYAAMVEHCDDMVGRIVSAVAKAGITENTMIVLTSDNGGLYRRYDYRAAADDNVSSQAPLKGEKGSLHEGGIRVPLIVKYPPMVKPGTVCSEPTISYDFYPTFVELAHGKLPIGQTIDGRSLIPLLTDANARLARNTLHWHYPHYHHDRPASSIRERDWKLVEYLDGTGDVEVYNLAEDIGETNNLVKENPGRAADLKKKLNQWRQQVIARMPYPNPNYDEQRADQWWSVRTGQPVDSDARKRFPPTEKGQ